MSWRFLRIVTVVLALLAVACGQSQDILPRPSPTPCPQSDPQCHCDYYKVCRVVYDSHGIVAALMVSDEAKPLAEGCGVKAVGYFGAYGEALQYKLWIGEMLLACWPWEAKYR